MTDSSQVIQGSQEWLNLRCGLVTASRIADVVAKTKSGPSASRTNYRAQLVAEILTGTPAESFTNAAMQHGVDTEPLARNAYESHKGIFVEQVGLIYHPTIKGSGASPDGLVDDDGLLEIKSPNTATHIDYLLDGRVPEKYKPQMAWQMACTNRSWCDFVSFDPRMPDDLQLFIIRYHRDDEYIKSLEDEVSIFIEDVNNIVSMLREIRT